MVYNMDKEATPFFEFNAHSDAALMQLGFPKEQVLKFEVPAGSKALKAA
jgi:hypothetical protein